MRADTKTSSSSGQAARQGTLVLVVGPSGVGKDTLLDGARERLAADTRFRFSHRDITRPILASGEQHHPVSFDEFQAKQRAGEYALSWEAHGFRYGIPTDVTDHLANGTAVIANVSRGVIDEARQRFVPLRVISISAPRDILEARLVTRGRESDGDIATRLDRAAAYRVCGSDVIVFSNVGPVGLSIDAFVGKLVAASRPSV